MKVPFFFSVGSDPQEEVLQPSGNTESSSVVMDDIPGIRGQVLISLDRPSLERFRISHFGPRIPVKLTGKQAGYVIGTVLICGDADKSLA